MFNNLKWIMWKKAKSQIKFFKYMQNLARINGSEYIKVLHYDIQNWGDAINPALVEMISGKDVLSVDIDFRARKKQPSNPMKDTLYMVIGSIAHHADSQTEIWGSGIQSSNLKLRQRPKAVHAVRGPLTAKSLIDQGIQCPNIYGDPALLLPCYLPMEKASKYKLGIVSHRKDIHNINIQRLAKQDDILLINMRDTSLDVISQINQCENIISTSLHGLILADAYGIASAWGRASELIPGGYFKYCDYYQSIGDSQVEPDIFFDGNANINKICDAAHARDIQLDLDTLLESCPFL